MIGIAAAARRDRRALRLPLRDRGRRASTGQAAHEGRRHHQPDQHDVGAGRRVPRVLHAGRASWCSRRASPDPGRPSTSCMECIVDTCLCGMLFWAFGFAFMFGAGNGCIGHQYFFLHGDAADLRRRRASRSWRSSCSSSPSPTPRSTITSGAMVGRTGFKGDILYSIGVSRLHLPDLRPLGLGPGRLARQHHGLVPRHRAGRRRVP